MQAGELKHGDKLPSHESLIREYRTTGLTVRRALTELELEQLVETRPTVGTFVRNQERERIEIGSGNLSAFTPTFPVLNDRLLKAIAGPDREISRTTQVSRAIPPSGVAQRLGTGQAPVFLRHHVFYVDDDRISLSNTYFPEHLVAGSALEATNDPGFTAFDTLDTLGLPADDLQWDLAARTATTAECREMRWPTALPVFVQICTAYTNGETPVGCWVIVLPGDRVLFTERCHRKARPNIRAAM
jgi:GntR family transcriptional regulator